MMEPPKRLKVLISAYACDPSQGSEGGVGWNWVKQMSRYHDLWVLTRAANREAIETALGKEPLPGVRWLYFDFPYWLRFWKRGRRGLHVYYYCWQIFAGIKARFAHREIGFDLVHHATFANYWMPSLAAWIPVPMVWGPVGGGESVPRALYGTLDLGARVYERVRETVRSLAHWEPLARWTAHRAMIGLAATEETARALRSLGIPRVEIFSQVGLDSTEIRLLNGFPPRSQPPCRFLSIGNLKSYKGFHLGLRAFAAMPRGQDNEYWIVGDGEERGNWERLCAQLGIGARVVFFGALRREDALAKLAECDVLVHPGLHDSGALVCSEAMAAGRPVICLDIGGPALQVTNLTGRRVPVKEAGRVISDLSAAMEELAGNPDLRMAMGRAGKARVVEFFQWASKGPRMDELYRLAAHGQAPRIKGFK